MWYLFYFRERTYLENDLCWWGNCLAWRLSYFILTTCQCWRVCSISARVDSGCDVVRALSAISPLSSENMLWLSRNSSMIGSFLLSISQHQLIAIHWTLVVQCSFCCAHNKKQQQPINYNIDSNILWLWRLIPYMNRLSEPKYIILWIWYETTQN